MKMLFQFKVLASFIVFPGFGDRLLSEVKKHAPKDIKIRVSMEHYKRQLDNNTANAYPVCSDQAKQSNFLSEIQFTDFQWKTIFVVTLCNLGYFSLVSWKANFGYLIAR